MSRRSFGKAQAFLWCLVGMISASLAFTIPSTPEGEPWDFGGWWPQAGADSETGGTSEMGGTAVDGTSETGGTSEMGGTAVDSTVSETGGTVSETGGTAGAAARSVSGLECFLGVVLAPGAVEVAAEIAGRLESVSVRVGDAVEPGEVLATLDTRTIERQRSVEQATLRTAEAQRRRRVLEVDRAEEAQRRRLDLEGLVSREQQEVSRFDSAVAVVALEEASAEVERAQAKIEQLEARLAKARIRAPFAGRVAHRYLDAGTVAAAGTPVLRLISAETLLTRFAVPPIQASAVVPGRVVRIEVAGLDLPLQGVVEQLAPEIDTASQMLFAEARLSAAETSVAAIASGAVARVSLAAQVASCSM